MNITFEIKMFKIRVLPSKKKVSISAFIALLSVTKNHFVLLSIFWIGYFFPLSNQPQKSTSTIVRARSRVLYFLDFWKGKTQLKEELHKAGLDLRIF